jgi:hypothetical protein
MPYFLAISAISSKGSKDPKTVVPEVALIKNGVLPSPFALTIAFSTPRQYTQLRNSEPNSEGIILPSESQAILIALFSPTPMVLQINLRTPNSDTLRISQLYSDRAPM